MAVRKTGVDYNLIGLVAQSLELSMGNAKCPIFGIIGRSIRDEIGLIGQRIQMLLQFAKRQTLPHRNAVAHDVQVRSLEIDDLLASFVLDIGVADVPLAWNCPVEDGGPGRNFMDVQGNVRANFAQSLPYAVTGNAAAKRENPGGKREQFAADIVGNELIQRTTPQRP